MVLNNKKDKLLELVMEKYLSKEDYKKQVDLINEDLTIYQTKMNKLKNNKKDKNNIENKISEIKNALEKCLENRVDLLILQSRSPSCGVNEIYDGTFTGQKIQGRGIFAKLAIGAGIKSFVLEDL